MGLLLRPHHMPKVTQAKPAKWRYHSAGALMSTKELEAEALKMPPQERARLAERLLESLENLTDEENAAVWAAEAERRNAAWDETLARPASDVLHGARNSLK